jgi:hypothetical protein
MPHFVEPVELSRRPVWLVPEMLRNLIPPRGAALPGSSRNIAVPGGVAATLVLDVRRLDPDDMA